MILLGHLWWFMSYIEKIQLKILWFRCFCTNTYAETYRILFRTYSFAMYIFCDIKFVFSIANTWELINRTVNIYVEIILQFPIITPT